MKRDWTTTRLGDVCEIIKGRKPHLKPTQTNADLPYLVAKVIRGVQEPQFASIHDCNSIVVEGNETIIICDGSNSGEVFTGYRGILSSTMGKIRKKAEIDDAYLRAFLIATFEIFNGAKTGAAIPHLDKEAMYALEFSFPSLTKQRQIMRILDEVFTELSVAQANAEKNLQNARALFESHLQFVFSQRGKGWVEKQLEEVCEISSLLVDPRETEFLDLPHIGGANIESKTGQLIDLKTAREEELISGKFSFNASMVLYSKIRPYLMKVARPNFGGLCSADIYPLVSKGDQIDRDFLFHLLLSPNFTNYAIAGSARAGIPKVNRDHLFAYRAILPPLSMQREWAIQLDALASKTQQLERIYKEKLTALAELKKALLHQAFTGELTRDWKESKIIPFPKQVPGITMIDLHAGILALAYRSHEKAKKTQFFGHVKAEKIAHMVEDYIGIDLGRTPIKDAAGPNDYPHLLRVGHRARKAEFFSFNRGSGHSYRVHKLGQFDSLVEKTTHALGDKKAEVDRLLALMLPMDTQEAEIFATVYAAWNNLLLDKKPISDEAIVSEARENWHPDKLNIPRDRFFKTIGWMKDKGVIPSGHGKRVNAKPG